MPRAAHLRSAQRCVAQQNAALTADARWEAVVKQRFNVPPWTDKFPRRSRLKHLNVDLQTLSSSTLQGDDDDDTIAKQPSHQ